MISVKPLFKVNLLDVFMLWYEGKNHRLLFYF